MFPENLGRLTKRFKSLRFPTELIRQKNAECEFYIASPQMHYASAIAALQAFNAPTTVKHITGLIAYTI